MSATAIDSGSAKTAFLFRMAFGTRENASGSTHTFRQTDFQGKSGVAFVDEAGFVAADRDRDRILAAPVNRRLLSSTVGPGTPDH